MSSVIYCIVTFVTSFFIVGASMKYVDYCPE